ncbi:MAG: glutathione peroxidase [Romboutsia sp.]
MFYKFSAKSIQGKEISMNEYRNKVILVVNTASKCGLTPQFKDLEELYREFKDKNFEILGFPCGQFKNQELSKSDDISSFCQINYGVTFKMFEKIDVNGIDAHPIYKYLKSQEKGIFKSDIKWNFTKFLIDDKGHVIKRYAPTTSPNKIKKDIVRLIK